MYRIHEEYVLTDDNLWAHEEGTPILVDLVNGAGAHAHEELVGR